MDTIYNTCSASADSLEGCLVGRLPAWSLARSLACLDGRIVADRPYRLTSSYSSQQAATQIAAAVAAVAAAAAAAGGDSVGNITVGPLQRDVPTYLVTRELVGSIGTRAHKARVL